MDSSTLRPLDIFSGEKQATTIKQGCDMVFSKEKKRRREVKEER